MKKSAIALALLLAAGVAACDDKNASNTAPAPAAPTAPTPAPTPTPPATPPATTPPAQ